MLERSILIKAPAAAVNAFLVDTQQWPDIYVGLQKVEPDDLFPGAGGTAQVVYKSAGVTFNLTFTSLEHVPEEKNVARMDGMLTGITTTLLAPQGKSTWVILAVEYEIPGRWVGRAIDRLLVERMNVEQLEQSLDNLKSAVEKGGSELSFRQPWVLAPPAPSFSQGEKP